MLRHKYVGRRRQFVAITFAHVAVTGDRAAFAGGVTDAARRQAHQADALFQLGLAVQLEQCNVVIQRLAVVIVMDVGGGNAQCLSAGAAVLPGQIVVAHPHVNCIARPNYAAQIE